MGRLKHAGLAMMVACLAACAAAPDRYVVPGAVVTDRQRIAFGAVEIREVSLPAYAASDEISQLDGDGRLTPLTSGLWADTPERSVALELARYLSQLSGARVASSPWPLESFPDARLDVRFESLVADQSGTFRAAGQYFVAVPEGGRERAGLFDLAVPFDPAAGPSAIAAARGRIILDLARFIATSGLR